MKFPFFYWKLILLETRDPWATNVISSERKGILKLNATEFMRVNDIDGQPNTPKQRISEAKRIQCIFNWMQCDFIGKQGKQWNF